MWVHDRMFLSEPPGSTQHDPCDGVPAGKRVATLHCHLLMIILVKFVAKRTHQENPINDAGNHVSRTSSLPRQEAVIQGLDCLPVSFHSELRERENYPKLRRRKRHFASLQYLHDDRRLVIEDGAHRRADRNFEETPPLVGVRRGVRRSLGHLRDDQHA